MPDYVEGDLNAADTQWMYEHVSACAACRHEEALCREAFGALRAPRRIETPDDLYAGFAAKLAKSDNRRTLRFARMQWVGAAACMVLTVLITAPYIAARREIPTVVTHADAPAGHALPSTVATSGRIASAATASEYVKPHKAVAATTHETVSIAPATKASTLVTPKPALEYKTKDNAMVARADASATNSNFRTYGMMRDHDTFKELETAPMRSVHMNPAPAIVAPLDTDRLLAETLAASGSARLNYSTTYGKDIAAAVKGLPTDPAERRSDVVALGLLAGDKKDAYRGSLMLVPKVDERVRVGRSEITAYSETGVDANGRLQLVRIDAIAEDDTEYR